MNDTTAAEPAAPASVPPGDTFQPPPVTNYKVLTGEQVNLMNEIKAHGPAVLTLVEHARKGTAADVLPKVEAVEQLILGMVKEKLSPRSDLDQRWVSIGVTKIQLGLNAITRAFQDSETADQRWVSIGLTEAQLGFMALSRSVAQPQGI